MSLPGDQKLQKHRYFIAINEIRTGDLLNVLRLEHRWEVIKAYLLGRGIIPHKTYDQRDPIAYYEWSVEGDEVASFEAGLDQIDTFWRDLLRVIE